MKRKPEKIQALTEFKPVTSAILGRCWSMLYKYQMSILILTTDFFGVVENITINTFCTARLNLYGGTKKSLLNSTVS